MRRYDEIVLVMDIMGNRIGIEFANEKNHVGR